VSGRDELVDSRAAWLRLAIAALAGTIGSVGMWSVVVVLPAVQAEFGVARADASLPYTLGMLGFAVGGIVLGRMADRFGIAWSLVVGTCMLALGYAGTAIAGSLWSFAIWHGALVGIGGSVTFGPLIADTSRWFLRRRGIAVSIAAAGNYLGGTIWPPLVEHAVASVGWRQTHMGIAIVCLATMLPLAWMLRSRVSLQLMSATASAAASARGALGLSPQVLQILLVLAGLSCCVAMSMPQVHIVAYCADLGYGPARGAEMLSLMLAFGIISRIGSGFVADRIGGIATLLLGSVLQAVALCLYLVFDGLVSLYVVSALFGLFQGGIVPMYAVIVREYFPPQEAGARVGLVVMATVVGMALGGWMSGAIFDWTGSYHAAFANGLLWNFLNVGIGIFLLSRHSRLRLAAA
jgi:MFS family permease